MALTAGTYAIGPASGALRVKTTRDGVAARVGHDLTIEFGDWSGQITLEGDDPAGASLHVDVVMASLTIIEGTGGLAPLSAGDRKDITATAFTLLGVAEYPTATYTSAEVSGSETGGAIDGTLTLHGSSGPVRVEVSQSGPTGWTGTATLSQSDFGIKPYKAFFGALKLADRVTISVEVAVVDN